MFLMIVMFDKEVPCIPAADSVSMNFSHKQYSGTLGVFVNFFFFLHDPCECHYKVVFFYFQLCKVFADTVGML